MQKLASIGALALCALVPAIGSHGPIAGYAQAVQPPQGDEFNATSFTAPFVVKCGGQAVGTCPDQQAANTWSLDSARAGFLRIMTQRGSLVGSNTDGSNDARNFVIEPVDPGADYTVTTSLTFPGPGISTFSPLGQTAGILVYQDDDHFIYLGRSFATANAGVPQIEFRQENGSTELVNTVTEPTPANATVYLRLTKVGTLYEASYSYDNLTFTSIAPGIPPTSTPTATATTVPTNTPTATVTPSETPTGTPSETPTATDTPTSTNTPTPTTTPVATSTSTPLPAGYTANYANPQVGLFAWGGNTAAAINNVIPADFDWFRAGANSQTPVPTLTATLTVTTTPVVTSTSTSTTTPVSTTPTSTAVVPTNTPTSTATSTPAPTNTPVEAPTNTPVPIHKPKPKFGFSYVSVWYHFIKVGHMQHLQAQARIPSKQGIWVTVQFANGRTLHYYTQTNSKGFWKTEISVPHGAITHKSNRSVVTFQLWKGKTTTKSFSTFRTIR